MITILKKVTGKEFKVKNRELMYPGGDIALLNFIASKLKYPIMSMVNKEQGTVYIVVTVDSLGRSKKVELLKGASKGLNEESLRIVSMIQNWFPKITDGKAVESKITIPVKFTLKGK
jgi:protein TonB